MNNIKFSANTGFLWKQEKFTTRIKNAKKAGFDALEFHDEAQNENLSELTEFLAEINLPICGMNVSMADTFGKAAIPGLENEAQEDIDIATNVATTLNIPAIHLLSGKSDDNQALDTFINSIEYALSKFEGTILLEPISQKAIPGYYLNTVAQANEIIEKIADERVKIMFDCFHIQHEEYDVLASFLKYKEKIGHIQIASFPNRNEPNEGKINYQELIPAFIENGYEGLFGCEYLPKTTVDEGIEWMQHYK